MPHPKAAIFLDDYQNDPWLLSDYLKYLMENHTAYEEHRHWRANFSESEHRKVSPLLQEPWTCRICRWALRSELTPFNISSCPTS